MKVLFKSAHSVSWVRRKLERGGWRIVHEAPAELLATHPEAADEAAARRFLTELDLLTSVKLQIEFQYRRPRRQELASCGSPE
jgi:hypothetical protein